MSGRMHTALDSIMRAFLSPRHSLLLAAVLALTLVPQTSRLPAQAQAITAGSLDTTFGQDGIVTSGVIPAKSQAHAVAALSDGKVLVAGGSIVGADQGFALARYTADGDLDTTFGGGDGRVTTPFGSGGPDIAYAMVVLSDGKILLAGQAYIEVNGVATSDFALARYTAEGVLDTTFGGGDGIVNTPIGTGHEQIRAIAVDTNGKIVAAGYTVIGAGNDDFAIVRYETNGTLDTSFGTDGKVITAVSSGVDSISAVAVQSDRKILAGGRSSNNFALARYTSAGALDTSFDTDGKVTTNFASDSRIHGLAVLNDGKIVAAGYAHDGTDFNFALSRYTSAGALDTTFDTDGKVTTDFSSDSTDQGFAMTVSGDKIVVAGESNNDFALARYTAATGALDTSFDTDGKVTTSIGTGEDRVNALAVQTNGRILAAGYSHNGTFEDFALARYTDAGALDTSFGRDAAKDGTRDGYVTTTLGVQHGYGLVVARQPDGKLVVVGNGHNGNTNQQDFVVARYNDDGTMDVGFGTDGVVTTDFNSGSLDYGRAVALQSDGKIVVAGRSNKGTVKDFAVARYDKDGSLDTSFGTGGKVTTDFMSGEDRPYAIAVQSDDDDEKIVVVGYAHNGTNQDFAIARYTSAGVLDTTFGGGDGKVMTHFGHGNDRGRAVVVQPDGKIVVVGQRYNGTHMKFIVARYTSAGALDTTFGGGDGWVMTDMGDGNDAALAVALQSDGKIVAGGAATIGSKYDFALARYNDDGSLDTTFGGDANNDNTRDGWVTTEVEDGLALSYSVLLQSGGRIVVTGFSHDGGPNIDTYYPPYDLALVRYTRDGDLDMSFGTGGKVTTPIGGDDDRSYGAVQQPDGKIVLAAQTRIDGVYRFALARYHSPTAATVSLSASPIRVDEGMPVTVTARLSSAQADNVTIPLMITDDTAESNDYRAPRSITIRMGETTGTAEIATNQDADTQDETFTVSLGTLPSGLVEDSPSSVEITIVDGDRPFPALEQLGVDTSLQRPADERSPYCYIGVGTNSTEFIRYPDGRIQETAKQSEYIRSMFACD